MYRLKHANSVPIRPSIFRTGFPVQDHMVPNIAIVSENNSDPVHLNAIVLREALLSSPEEVEKLLGLKVKDVLNKPVPKATPKPKEPKQEDVKETKEVTPSQESKEVDDEWA
jgi:hypothetical protein